MTIGWLPLGAWTPCPLPALASPPCMDKSSLRARGFPGRRHCLSIGRRPGGLRQTWRLEITQVYRYGSLVRSLTQRHWQHGGASGASLVQVAGRTSLLTSAALPTDSGLASSVPAPLLPCKLALPSSPGLCLPPPLSQRVQNSSRGGSGPLLSCSPHHLPWPLTLNLAQARLQSCSPHLASFLSPQHFRSKALALASGWLATQVGWREGTGAPPTGLGTQFSLWEAAPTTETLDERAGRPSSPRTRGQRGHHAATRLPHPPLINGEIGRLILGRRREGGPVAANMGPNSLSAATARITEGRLTSPTPRASAGLALMHLPRGDKEPARSPCILVIHFPHRSQDSGWGAGQETMFRTIPHGKPGGGTLCDPRSEPPA